MKKFKIGDRVVAKVPVGGKHAKDQHGTVIGFNGIDISVEFDKDIGGHTCSEQREGRNAKDGYGWFVLPRNLKLETNRFKVGQIYRVDAEGSPKIPEAGNIIKIVSMDGHHFRYDTLRGDNCGFTWFRDNSPFAEFLTLLSGKEISKAIRKWDEKHVKKQEQKGKHSYTDEEIEQAKKLCGKMMLEAFDDGNTFNLRILDKNYDKSNSAVNCEISRFNNAHNSSATARCSDHDEYSVWIGRCVALCKALHKPIPAFIMEG